MRHSTKPRTQENMLEELLDRVIRLETRLCVLMKHMNVTFDGRDTEKKGEANDRF